MVECEQTRFFFFFFFLTCLLLLLFFFFFNILFYFILFLFIFFYFVWGCVCVCVWWSEGCGVMSRYNCVKANEVTPSKQTANPCAPLPVANL